METSYSLLDAILALHTGTWDRIPSAESRESNSLLNASASPVGRARIPGNYFKRAPLVAAGSPLVQTVNQGFLGSLQAMSTVGKLGAQFLALNQSTTRTPIVTSAGAPAWQPAEGDNVAETNLVLGLRTWEQHHCPISIILSGQLIKQGKNVEQYVMSEMLHEGAAELDRVCIQGDGTAGRPTGITNTAGITAASGTALNYAGLVAGVQAVSDANSVLDCDSIGYIGSPGVAGTLKQRQGPTVSEVMWSGGLARGSIDGDTAYATTNCPAGDLIFGDFSNLIVGVWGDNISFDVDPYTGFQAAQITLRLWLTLDIQLRSPAGFTVFSGVT